MISNWLAINRISLNASKSKLMMFSSGRQKVEESAFKIEVAGKVLILTNTWVLRLIKRLIWDPHVKSVVQKARAKLFAINRFAPSSSLVKVRLYKALILLL